VDERLESVLARLELERVEADRRYNDALTAVDRAFAPAAHAPAPPDTRPAGGSLKAQASWLLWRLVSPFFGRQRRFNAALVDHLNRQADAQAQFQAHLLRYLQAITAYVDTKDRAATGQKEVQVLNAAISALADDWMKRWESLGAREARYDARHQALTSTYESTYEGLRRAVVIAQQSALALKREVERLLESGVAAGSPGLSAIPGSSVPRATPDLDAYVYVGFEDLFRGSRDEIRARLEDYLPLFAGASDVLDLGCGRGEFLDLFRQHGIAARGIDVNVTMVEACRERGLQAEQADAVDYLSRQADASLGGIVAIQVVEHLEPAYLMRLIETARHKLRPGAPIILETINPACWTAFFESYIRDLSHVRPLHPETLRYLVQVSGYSSVDVQFRSPVPADHRLPRVLLTPLAPGVERDTAMVDVVDAINAHADLLNARLFTFMDYAVVAWR
jgi:SAM-dependent methyltransferase